MLNLTIYASTEVRLSQSLDLSLVADVKTFRDVSLFTGADILVVCVSNKTSNVSRELLEISENLRKNVGNATF